MAPLLPAALTDTLAADPAPATSFTDKEETISLLDIIAVLVKRRRLIMGMTGCIAVLLLGYAALTTRLPVGHPMNLLPNVYTPTAEVLLSPAKSGNSSLSSLLSQSSLGSLAGLLGSGVQGNPNADLALKLLKGATLRDEIAQQLDFAGHYHLTKNIKTASQAVLNSAVKTQYDAASSVLTISYTDTDKVFATNVLNALVAALERRFTGLTAQRLEETGQLLQQQLAGTESDFKAAENALVDFSRTHGIVDINAQRSSSVDINAGFRQQLANKELTLAEISVYRSLEDPEVRQLQNEVAVLRKFISESTGGFQQFSPTSIPENQVPEVAAAYLNLQYDLQLKQSIYMSTRQSWESVLLEQKGSVPEFQVLEKAQVPELKSGPSRSHIVIIGTIVAGVLAILIAFILEYFGRAAADPVEAWKLRRILQMLPHWNGRHGTPGAHPHTTG
jgi:uncharacterized protein involved in exopolysaccharide biosynthesis